MLRIGFEAPPSGIEALASHPEAAAMDKGLVALKGLADAACETIETLATAVDGM